MVLAPARSVRLLATEHDGEEGAVLRGRTFFCVHRSPRGGVFLTAVSFKREAKDDFWVVGVTSLIESLRERVLTAVANRRPLIICQAASG